MEPSLVPQVPAAVVEEAVLVPMKSCKGKWRKWNRKGPSNRLSLKEKDKSTKKWLRRSKGSKRIEKKKPLAS